MVDITSNMPWNPHELNDENDTMELDEYEQLNDQIQERKMNMKKHLKQNKTPEEIAPFFFYPSNDVIEKTLSNTTQFGDINHTVPMQVHHKS